jgi:signal transduction histidine kinase
LVDAPLSGELHQAYRAKVVWITGAVVALVLPAAALYPVLPGHGPVDTGPYYLISGLVVAAQAAFTAAALRRATTHEMALHFVWSVTDVWLICAGMGVSGGGRSPGFALFFLIVVAAAIFYPVAFQVALMAIIIPSYLVMSAVAGRPMGGAETLLWFSVLGGAGLIANLPARQLNRRLTDLELANAQLAELDRLKRDFIANSSHELRTPLTVAHGLAKTLDSRWDDIDDPKRREFIGRITANAEALSQTIDLLLDFARLEGGRLQPDSKPFDLSALVGDNVDRTRPLLGERPLILEIEPGVKVRADAALIDRVVTNLLANASAHTDPSTRVCVSVASTGGLARVVVSDDGPGIPAEELPHLGERFFRGGDVDSRGTRGTGLGLAFSREILALHGSTLDITSERGLGSSFGFVLPLVGKQQPLTAVEA